MSFRTLQLTRTLPLWLLLLHQTAGAAGWEGEGKLSLGGNYSDNPTLLTEDRNPEGKASTVGAVRMSFQRQSENNLLTLEPRVTRNNYPDRDFKDAEHTNLYLDGSSTQTYQRSRYGLSFGISDQGILQSEQDDSGNFNAVGDSRRQYNFSPTVAWSPSQRDTLQLGVSYSKTDFEKDFTGRSDFDTLSGRLNYSRRLNERSTFGATALYTTYSSERLGRLRFPPQICAETPPPEDINDCDPVNIEPGPLVEGTFKNDTDGYSFSLNYDYQWSETTVLSADYGGSSSDLDSTVTLFLEEGNVSTLGSSTSDNTQYGLGLTNQTEMGSVELRAKRSVVPSSNGTPQNRDNVSARIVRRLLPNLTGNLFLVGSKQESIADAASAIRGETKTFRAEAELSWSIRRNFSLVSKYEYRYRSRDQGRNEGQIQNQDDDGKATSNGITFGFTYAFDI
jgi:hypothetical protein